MGPLQSKIQQLEQLLSQAMLWDRARLAEGLHRLKQQQLAPAHFESKLNQLIQKAQASVHTAEKRRQSRPSISYPHELPITAKHDEILQIIQQHQVVIIAGETGSGKTTQAPKICVEAGLALFGRIGCTQPRRVAALSISRRIAQELALTWGKEVGCKIRFDDRTSDDTYIKLMTDGILLAEAQGDPLLNEYSVLVIDEAHERSLNIDFLLGHIRQILPRRPDLKVLITSATIDTERFSKAFGNAPVVEVSGRMYPVDVFYSPLTPESSGEGIETDAELTYTEAAAKAVEDLLQTPGGGDVLVFLPAERDIRETREMLAGRLGSSVELLPLFGRLSSGEQERVFTSSTSRRVILATNIAETSLTIPNIRFVVDTGLARISRYNPRTRTRRLPIEPISQSSANQRKGRCGRVQNGICIRLYSEADFLDRPPYTQPEIQRTNLAEVILRMKAFKLGEIETFPFLEPPQPAAIQAGYKLLHELGAIDEERELTALGRELARLPIDPTMGRMLLQSRKEGATPELLIIAAGLSIQDPRERPMDQTQAADSAHRQFLEPTSDFLTLLNIWDSIHEQWETLRSQNQRRRFCKSHFLSYVRMREWEDLHEQLSGVLRDLDGTRHGAGKASYSAIHRSVLAGLPAQVAQRISRNIYKTAGNRQVTLFPGSALFERQAEKKAPAEQAKPKAKISRQPEWIVAGEIVETSQLFARTAAGIDPVWLVDLAPHLCRYHYSHLHWDAKAERVLAQENITLFGLPVHSRRIGYGKINPAEATEIFIRSALVDEEISRGYPFLKHNKALKQKIENWQTRSRDHSLTDLDAAFFRFYSQRIQNVSSVHELHRFLHEHEKQNPQILHAHEEDIVAQRDLKFDSDAFPDRAQIGGHSFSVSYAYAPGEENDGATLKVPAPLAHAISPAAVSWAIPGLREPQVAELLRSLPKALRRDLMPLQPKIQQIAKELQPSSGSLAEDLSHFIERHYRLRIPPDAWADASLPLHLQPRIELIDERQRVIDSGRNLIQLRKETAGPESSARFPEWNQAAQRWEQFGLTGWTFKDLPASVLVAETAGTKVYGWLGLQQEKELVHIRLFPSEAEAKKNSQPAVRLLLERELQKDFAWLQKDLRSLSECNALFVTLGPPELLQQSAFENLRAHILGPAAVYPLRRELFDQAVTTSRERMRGTASQLAGWIKEILTLRQKLLLVRRPYSGLRQELDALIPSNFLRTTPYAQLQHLPRYLKAMLIRAERAGVSPAKDQEKAKRLAPFIDKYRQARQQPLQDETRIAELAKLRWMIEEFKVSLFAQELGTAFPISEKRLAEQIEQLR